MELGPWLKRFRAFYANSQMHRAEIEEQRTYLNMYLDSRVRIEMDRLARTDLPIYAADKNIRTAITVLREIFERKHPIRRRQKSLLKTVPAKGENIQSFYELNMRLSHTAELEKIKYEDLLANLFITAVSDLEIKGELMKLKNPACEEIRDKIDQVIMWREDMGTNNNITYDKPARALAADSSSSKTIKCYMCAGDHLAAECTKDKSKLNCTKCSKIGHVAQVCQGGNFRPKGNSNKKTRGSRGGKDNRNNKPQFAKQATEEVREPKQEAQHHTNRGEPEVVQCKTARARTGCATPPLLL